MEQVSDFEPVLVHGWHREPIEEDDKQTFPNLCNSQAQFMDIMLPGRFHAITCPDCIFIAKLQGLTGK